VVVAIEPALPLEPGAEDDDTSVVDVVGADCLEDPPDVEHPAAPSASPATAGSRRNLGNEDLFIGAA
jgi:hypothetical protein